MKQIESMRELFTHELQDLYHAEKQLLKALPKITEKASSKELKSALKEHTQETEEHVHRLEECFKKLGEKAASVECKAMKGIIAEVEEMLSQKQGGPILDAGLIGAAQKAEHYEIASYGTACEWANVLGQDEVGDILAQTLAEEEKADGLLTNLARKGINREATAA